MMNPFKKLDGHEITVVHDWLRTLGFPVNRMLHRDYADGVLVAKLLKRMYPRLVDLHNYQTRFSFQLKSVNWQTLNFKVFRRIGLSLSKYQIESLAKGEIGAIERLFWALMNHTVNEREKSLQNNKKLKTSQQSWQKEQLEKPTEIPCLSNLNSSTSFNSLNSNNSSKHHYHKSAEKIGDSPKHLPFTVYEKALNEVRNKVTSLEEILRQRDNDIKVLLERVKVYETENREFRKVVGLIKKLE